VRGQFPALLCTPEGLTKIGLAMMPSRYYS